MVKKRDDVGLKSRLAAGARTSNQADKNGKNLIEYAEVM
jgi:hypothetical protein